MQQPWTTSALQSCKLMLSACRAARLIRSRGHERADSRTDPATGEDQELSKQALSGMQQHDQSSMQDMSMHNSSRRCIPDSGTAVSLQKRLRRHHEQAHHHAHGLCPQIRRARTMMAWLHVHDSLLCRQYCTASKTGHPEGSARARRGAALAEGPTHSRRTSLLPCLCETDPTAN